MIFLLPMTIIIGVIFLLNSYYYSDTKPKTIQENKVIEKKVIHTDDSQKYLNKYIKKQ